jgi:drug/metabolite transporter (DMT)-like permease
MTNKKWILLLLFIAGLIILLLPDQGKPVIAFNEKHGPSWPDTIGLLIMLISWLLSCIVTVRNWRAVRSKMGKSFFNLLVWVYILSITGIVFSLMFSSDPFLWSCVAIAGAINILFIIHAFSKK